ncbi:MAG: tetratricopeptide repeat protein [Burkholderiaceae bacterium]|nr:tetratricopeptide repeat protein [Burkholderiaceae bacterium]
MNHYVKLFSALSASTLLGCSQLSLAPTGGEPVAAAGSRASVVPRVQPVEHISGPVSEVEGMFIMGRSAHGAGQLALAEECYEKVLTKQPAHLGALNSIAVIYAQTERTDKALQFFKRALALDPQASYVHNNFGYALLLAGQLAEAESELKLAHDLNPSSSQTRKNIELLALSKERAAALAGLTGSGSFAEAAVAGPQLLALGKNIYELRDGPVTLPTRTQAATLAGVQTEKPVSSMALHGVRIEVSNGVGIRHLAQRTANRLAPMGVVTARLTNQPRYQQSKTEIQFSAGQKSAADALSTKLPVAVRSVLSSHLEKNIQMRLVLGHDLVGKAITAWLESTSEIRVALAGYDGWRLS